MIWNKTESKVEINGDVRIEKEYLVKDEAGATPAQLLKFGEIDECKFNYKAISFPNETNFKTIPFSSCCFSFSKTTAGAKTELFACHTDPGQCIVPGKRVMYKMRSKCKEAHGKMVREYFNFTMSD